MNARSSVEELRRRAGQLPRISLTELPTPFQECPALAEGLGGGIRFFMKRDDLTTLGCGGNKLRKLEFSLGEAKATGCDVIVHGLAAQSNYCRQAAAAAAKVGLPCYLVLRKDHKAEDPPQANRLLDYVFGAKVLMVESDKHAEAKRTLVTKLQSQGHKPYVIGYHDEVLGAVGYALCMAEIMEQQAFSGVGADYVCVTGRSGTQAGLVLGKRLLGFEGRVLGFHPAPTRDDKASREGAARIATEAAALLGMDETFTIEDMHNTSAYGGEAYGAVTGECLEALFLLGRTEGLVAGPVYTAKGLAGVIDYVRTGTITEGSTIVFVHTGGVPETYAYNAEIAGWAGAGG